MTNAIRPFLSFAAIFAAVCLPAAAQAQGYTVTETVEYIEIDADWSDEPTTLTYTDDGSDAVSGAAGTARYAANEVGDFAPSRPVIARYGPFNLVAADTVEMIGTVDSDTPAQFAALLAAHPGVQQLVMVECPGSVDEDANHLLARTVRNAGITTHVPAGGSVRSGAVELWLAGIRRTAAPSAEFGVHSWRDEDGREGRTVAANDPVHADYLAYYREMGLADDQARRFYAITNSVGFDDVRNLSTADMAALGLVSGAA